MRIQSTKSSGNDQVKMLIFGESGSGKTHLAKTLKEPTIIISAESGLLTLKDSSIDVIDVSKDDNGSLLPKEKRIERLAEAHTYLTTKEAQAKYKVVFVDSVSEISQLMLDKLRVEYPSKSDVLKMYGENLAMMVSLIKAFRDLPHYSVILTALSGVDKDENGQRYIGVDLIGKISTKIQQYLDEVFYLEVITQADGTRVRELITGKTEKLMCKDRSGELAFREPADLGLIFSKIRKEKKNVGSK